MPTIRTGSPSSAVAIGPNSTIPDGPLRCSTCVELAHYQPDPAPAARRADISEAAVLAEQLLDAETSAS